MERSFLRFCPSTFFIYMEIIKDIYFFSDAGITEKVFSESIFVSALIIKSDSKFVKL